MSNTDDMLHIKYQAYDAAAKLELPPLSPDDALSRSSTVCATVRIYLAVWDDLVAGQRGVVSLHIQMCEQCAHEQQLLLGVTRSIARLPQTEPLARVDRAVLDAIAARWQANSRSGGGRKWWPTLYLHCRLQRVLSVLTIFAQRKVRQ